MRTPNELVEDIAKVDAWSIDEDVKTTLNVVEGEIRAAIKEDGHGVVIALNDKECLWDYDMFAPVLSRIFYRAEKNGWKIPEDDERINKLNKALNDKGYSVQYQKVRRWGFFVWPTWVIHMTISWN